MTFFVLLRASETAEKVPWVSDFAVLEINYHIYSAFVQKTNVVIEASTIRVL